MAIQKEKTYMVLNYSGSPVSITTQRGSVLVQGGSREEPYGVPLTADEIITANMNGVAFKSGLLWFDPEIEEEMYKELRITGWKDLMKDWEIEEMLMNPSAEGYRKLLAIDDQMYFSRVRGVLLGLQSVFADVPNQSKVLVDARSAELNEGKRRSEIKITNITPSTRDVQKQLADKDARIAELEAQLAAMQNADGGSKPDTGEPETEPTEKPKRTSSKYNK